MAAEGERHPGRIQVSNKQPLFFYVNLGKRLLAEHGEIQLSALGLAVATMVTVAELLKKDQLAVEKKVTTSLLQYEDDGKARSAHKPKLEVLLGKSPEFDTLWAEHLRAAAEKEAAAAAAGGGSNSAAAPAVAT